VRDRIFETAIVILGRAHRLYYRRTMPKSTIKEKVMPFGEHLEDLRRRLLIAMIGIVPVLVVSLIFGSKLISMLIIPILAVLRDADIAPSLQATSPLETFMTALKVSLTLTFVVTSPWLLLQIWLFIAPGLYNNERRFAYLLAPLSILLTVLGVTFCYTVIFPITLAFLIKFGSSISQAAPATAPVPVGVVIPIIPQLEAEPSEPPLHGLWYNAELKQLRYCAGKNKDGTPHMLGAYLVAGSAIAQQYRVSEYIGLLLALCFAFALAFQMPVVVLILGWANIVQIAFLTKYRKQAVFVCAILGALLTPTIDPFTMFLLAGPLYGLYELGIILLRILPASRVAAGFKKIKEPDGDPDA